VETPPLSIALDQTRTAVTHRQLWRSLATRCLGARGIDSAVSVREWIEIKSRGLLGCTRLHNRRLSVVGGYHWSGL